MTVSAFTGLGLAEDAELIASGIRDGSWIDGTLGGFGATLDTLALAMDPLGTLAAWGVAWLIEHVRPLQEGLDWLAGNADEVTAQATTWSQVAAAVEAARQSFADRIQTELVGWSGATAEAYRAHAGTQLTVLQGLSTATGGIASAVEGAGLVVGLVRSLVRDLIAQFVGTLAVRLPQWLAMEGLSLGVATPLVASQVAGLVARWVNEIQRFLRALLASLRRLLPKVDSLKEALDRLRMLSDRLSRPHTPGSKPDPPPPAGGGASSGLTTPSSPPDPARQPRGDRTPAHPTKKIHRPLRRENESADTLAAAGFDVEQNPPKKTNGKEPDYRIEGRYFDCYAPQGGNLNTIRDQISDKVKEDQAYRIILNLEDTPRTTDEIANMLQRKPVADLEEILVIQDGNIVPFYPFGE
ncbi:hypothetical protein AB0M02_22485 [Actinoplanes sp. NPDC051861]|uniref:CdiA C-terminal domain-containing protein n=1 Tax=Actinoplanes sp. NPDC051861 TaxID=3155170 RepID=UPI003448F5A0